VVGLGRVLEPEHEAEAEKGEGGVHADILYSVSA
jgi:hypothetical protein